MSNLFDDLAEVQTEETTSVETATENTTEKTETAETARETITVESLSELPDGYVEVKEFAFKLTMENMNKAQAENRTPTPDDMVDAQTVYAATRGKRWSLPALDAVDVDGNKLGIVIPLEAGLAAWADRPERGTGTGSVGMTPERREKRILRAGKAHAALKTWEKRVKRYGELLAEVDANWDDAHAAYEAWMETEEGKKSIKDDSDKE